MQNFPLGLVFAVQCCIHPQKASDSGSCPPASVKFPRIAQRRIPPCPVPPSCVGIYCNSQEMVCDVWVGWRGRSVTTNGRSCSSAGSQPTKEMVPSCSAASLGDAQVVPSRAHLEVIFPCGFALFPLHWCNLFHCRISENSQESVLTLG